jgi:guanylate kinase
VRLAMADGFCVILVIDVQGGFQVRQKVPQALLVFVQPPSLEALEDRLRARGTDDETTIKSRLTNARREIEMAAGYDVHVINDELDRAVERLAGILEQHGCGLRRNHD